MKKLFVLLLLCLCAVQAMAYTNKFKEIKNFPMGCWQFIDAKVQSEKDVKAWKDLGLNLVISPTYFADTTPKEDMIALLDQCEAQNIKVILLDRRVSYTELSKGEDVYRKQVQATIDDFGSHPAVVGFYVCDEPNKSNLDLCLKATKINKEMAPHLSPFVNQNPWGDDAWFPSFLGFDTCEKYVDYICKNGAIDLISMDCYFQMDPDNPDGMDNYFRSLNRYSKEAIKHNLPFYVTNLSVGHYNYMSPNADNIRWHINTSFAHGANGLMWYSLRPSNLNSNYRDFPINVFGERTKVFEDLSFENRLFSFCYDKVAPTLTLKQAYHVYKAYGDTPLFEGNDIISSVKSKTEVPVIISFFSDDYVAIVNNSFEKNSYVSFALGKNIKKIELIKDEGKYIEIYPGHYGQFKLDPATNEMGFWLAPGGMELFKITK